MEKEVNTSFQLQSNATKQPSATKAAPSGIFGKVKAYGQKLANNIDPLNLYARLKDYYKGIEILAPFMADVATRGAIKLQNTPDHTKAAADYASTLSPDSAKWTKEERVRLNNLSRDMIVELGEHKASQSEHSSAKRYNNLRTGAYGDVAFFGIQSLLSWFSGWAEKEQVKRTLGDIASLEFSKDKSDLSFSDLKKSKNPLLREAASYYGKKAFIRSITDFAGLIRLIPLAIYGLQKNGLFGTNLFKADENNQLIDKHTGEKSTMLGRNLNRIAQFGDGIKALMFAKTFFFQWYFGSRQTGSFYEAKDIWNITEGIASAPNRALNENIDTGEFVTRQHITKLYQRFQEENPKMGMAEFTRDDPLSSRIFEQTARYLNHTYMPKLFIVSEPTKQDDLPRKTLTHAMLVEFVGTGGLRVEDALGSALRLEVMAYHGRHGVQEGIKKYHEVSEILNKIPHPDRASYVSQDQAVESVRDYLAQMDAVGREYLGDYWPPKYINEELKRGFVKAIFEGKEISEEKIDYMASAIFMRETVKERTYRPKESDPTSEFLDTAKEDQQELAKESRHRKQLEASKTQESQSHSNGITRKRLTDIIERPITETDIHPASPTLH